MVNQDHRAHQGLVEILVKMGLQDQQVHKDHQDKMVREVRQDQRALEDFKYVNK